MASYSVTVTHPLAEHPRHTCDQIRAKLKRWYGCANPDQWYEAERRRISDTCARDPHGIGKHASLEAFWADRQARDKWDPLFFAGTAPPAMRRSAPQDAAQPAAGAISERRDGESDDAYAGSAA